MKALLKLLANVGKCFGVSSPYDNTRKSKEDSPKSGEPPSYKRLS